MRHRVLPQAKALAACEALLVDPTADVDDFFDWSGEGEDLDTTLIERLDVELRSAFQAHLAGPDPNDLDRFEGRVGARLHEVLEQAAVPVEVLDEPGFWGYLTVRYFWWFVTARQRSTFESRDFAKYGKYVDGSNARECVVLRAYLRGWVTHRESDSEPYELAYALPRSTDFWRSHVIRVKTGSAPVLTQAFARAQRNHRMQTDELRGYARRLNRIWSNVVLHVYDEAEADALIEELRE